MIIENKQLQSKTVKSAWLSVTLLMWFIYAYLWLPLISLVAWWFGYQTFTFHMITLDGIAGVKTLLADYFLIGVLFCSALLVWARVEKFRFEKSARRSKVEPVKNQSVAQYFKLNEVMLTQMQTKNIITVEFNKEGEMTHFSE